MTYLPAQWLLIAILNFKGSREETNVMQSVFVVENQLYDGHVGIHTC